MLFLRKTSFLYFKALKTSDVVMLWGEWTKKISVDGSLFVFCFFAFLFFCKHRKLMTPQAISFEISLNLYVWCWNSN